jgi:hypothetical protein
MDVDRTWGLELAGVRKRVLALIAIAMGAAALAGPKSAMADNVVADDQIVQGSQCVGLDCVDGEAFGFTSLGLKENNTRLLFNDTSSAAGFSSENWGLIANSNLTGVDGYFGLMDLGATGTDTTGTGTYPFKVAAGAGDNALSIDNTGNIGFGTDTPGKSVEVKRGDTPAIRLDQSGGAFAPQTWDVAGNESNFFVRDATGATTLPFRIRPDAPTSSIDISASGDVGVGIANPTAPLDLQRGNGTAKVRIAETNSTTTLRNLIDLENNGPANIQYANTSAGTHPTWLAGTGGPSGDDYLVDTQGSATPPLRVGSTGDVYSGAALSQNADPAQQTDVQPVDPATVLDQVAAVPLVTWTYTGDASGGRHIGPTASAFQSASGLGPAQPTVAPGDVGGVALAGVQALKTQFDALAAQPDTAAGQAAQNVRFRSQIDRLRKQKNNLRKRLKKLEKAVYGH